VDVLSHGLGGDGAMPRESMNSPRRSASVMGDGGRTEIPREFQNGPVLS